MEKKLLRNKIIDKRGSIPEDEKKVYSENIINKIINSNYYKNAQTIMSFISFAGEVNTHELIKQANKDGKDLTVPITFPENHELKPSIVKNFSELEVGFYNILEPKKEFQRFIDPAELDLIIVPGVAFRKDGYRVGYGGGYYDRFLSEIPNTPTIAIAFSAQIVDDLPVDSYDIPVDYIYTEEGIIDCKKSR